jgi:hypothetical protein
MDSDVGVVLAAVERRLAASTQMREDAKTAKRIVNG